MYFSAFMESSQITNYSTAPETVTDAGLLALNHTLTESWLGIMNTNTVYFVIYFFSPNYFMFF